MSTLTRADITELKEESASDQDIILGFHRKVIPQWDSVRRIDGHVKVSPHLYTVLHKLCCELVGGNGFSGAFLNYGPSQDESLTELEYSIPNVVYQTGK